MRRHGIAGARERGGGVVEQPSYAPVGA